MTEAGPDVRVRTNTSPLWLWVAICVAASALGCSWQQPFLDYPPERGVKITQPPDDVAQVVLIPEVAVSHVLAFYDGDEYLMPLALYTFHVYRTEPGPHRLGLVGPKNALFLEADLEGGKTYFVLGHQVIAGRYALKPTMPDQRHLLVKVSDRLTSSFAVTPNAQADTWYQQKKPRMDKLRAKALEKWLAKPADSRARIEPKYGLLGDFDYRAVKPEVDGE
jgi:hypothetical protein